MNGLSIVIPSKTFYNLACCAQSIRFAGETYRIIVVDDGVEWPFDEPPAALGNFEGIMGKSPFVFSRNVNIGIEHAGTDDVIIMNDDALLKTPGGFTALQRTAYELGGMVSAACTNVGNPNQFPQPGGKLRMEHRMVCFVCVCIPRFVIDKVGLLDETFGRGGFEDDDFCLRARRAGFPIGVFDGCVIDHGSLVSTFRGPGGPGYTPDGAEIFRRKWGAGNHDL